MKIFAKYFDENGEVYLFRPKEMYDRATNTFKPTDENTFTVGMEKFSPLGNSEIWQRTFYDFDVAVDEYRACIDKLHTVCLRVCARQIQCVAVHAARKIAHRNLVGRHFGRCFANLV